MDDFWDRVCIDLLVSGKTNSSLPIVPANCIAPFMGHLSRRPGHGMHSFSFSFTLLHTVWINQEAGKAFTFSSEEDFVSALREFEGALRMHCMSTFCVADRYGAATELKDDTGQTVRSREDLHDCSSKSKEELVKLLAACGIKKKRLEACNREALLALITNLRHAKKECFAKVFGTHWGRTGGSFDGICPHLTQYVFFPIARPESARYAAQLLAWFHHLPHCACYDFWCGCSDVLVSELAKVGVRLGEAKGGIVPEAEFDAKKHMMPVSVPELAMECAPSLSFSDASLPPSTICVDVDRPPHAVTRRKSFVAVHDPFHGKPHKRCQSREICNIQETRTVNASRQEQYNRLRLLHDPFLRNEAFQRNIFMHLVLMHRRNRSLAQDALFKLELQIEHAHKLLPQFQFTLAVNRDTGRIEIRSQRR